jgi:hypothetical protein
MLLKELGNAIIACLWIKSSYELLFIDNIFQEGTFKMKEVSVVE